MPPRHGKSLLISQYFPAWYLLNYPWKRVILCSYEGDFAAQWGRKVRDTVSEMSRFWNGVQLKTDSTAASRWEIEKHGGGMQTAGIGGPILGKGADVIILDDVTKNAKEALSPTWRAHAWDWFTSTALTRLEPGGAIINVQQRWHTEDMGGMMTAHEPARWKVLKLPALAEGNDLIGRHPGEALWPERYPRETLEDRQKLAPVWFAAQYQQRPIDLEGGFFRGLERIGIVDAAPVMSMFTSLVRFWDLASTESQAGSDPDYTVGILMGRHKDGTFWVLDMVRGRWGPKGVRDTIRQTAHIDGKQVKVRVEREGGASGKIVADLIVREELAGFPARGVQPEGSKAERAEPWGSQIEAGNVRLVKSSWSQDLINEHRVFPTGTHDDIVDACSGAFTDLAATRPGGWEFR